MAIAKIMVNSGYNYSWDGNTATMDDYFDGGRGGTSNARSYMGFEYYNTSIFQTSLLKSVRFCFTSIETKATIYNLSTLSEAFNESIIKSWDTDGSTGIQLDVDSVMNSIDKIDVSASVLFLKKVISNGICYKATKRTDSTSHTSWSHKIYSHRINNPAYRPYLEIEYIDDNAPPVCSKLAPNNTFVDASRTIDFAWSYSQEINTPQSHYDFQYSIDSGKTWKYLATQVASTLQTYKMPANTISPGTTLWRVRSYMRSTIVSAWSEIATVLVRSAPAMPLVSGITNVSRPTIAWQSPSQQAFELKLLQNNTVIHESGIIATVDRFYKIPFYLADGEYQFSLRVINEFDLSSDWANVSTIITTTKPAPPIVTLSPIQNGIKLAITNATLFQKLYVLRDGVPIQKLTNFTTAWTDYTSVGVHDYVVRGIDEYDNFSGSEKLTAKCCLLYDTLSVAANPENMLLIKSARGAKLTRKGSLSMMGEQRFFAGREQPIFEFSEHSAQQIELEFSILQRDKIDFEKLKRFIQQRKTLLLRTKKHGVIYGVIASLEYTDDGIAVDCTAFVSEVSSIQQISYDK